MSDPQIFHQPTLRQLLNSEALTETQVVYGEDLLDRAVVQVVATLTMSMRSGSLVICRPDMLSGLATVSLEDLAAVVLIKQTAEANNVSASTSPPAGAALA